MSKLCREVTDNHPPESKTISELPEIRKSELNKQRKTITPVFERDDITYPNLGIGDVIAITKESNETLYYLLIQRTHETHITYRIDTYKPKRYDYFESHNSIIALLTEHEAKIYYDPFNIRSNTQKTTNKLLKNQ